MNRREAFKQLGYKHASRFPPGAIVLHGKIRYRAIEYRIDGTCICIVQSVEEDLGFVEGWALGRQWAGA